MALEDLPTLHCLSEDSRDLLVGTDEGLFRVPLYPAEAGSFEATAVPGLEDKASPRHPARRGALVARDLEGDLATSKTTVKCNPSRCVRTGVRTSRSTPPTRARAGPSTSAPNSASFSTNQAPVSGTTTPGRTRSRTGRSSCPTTAMAGSCPARGGRAARRACGAARAGCFALDRHRPRYRPLRRPPEGQMAFKTVLEAFPDLTEGRVFAIEEDARGLVWFGTDQGSLALRRAGLVAGAARTDGNNWGRRTSCTMATSPSRGDPGASSTPRRSGSGWRARGREGRAPRTKPPCWRSCGRIR